jgi:hypothetical protein
VRYKFPRSFRDAGVSDFTPALAGQIEISILLGYGFVFSLVTIGGLGSLIAFAIGWHARIKIKRSQGRLAGLWLAWWCIIVGGLSAVIEPLFIASVVAPH